MELIANPYNDCIKEAKLYRLWSNTSFRQGCKMLKQRHFTTGFSLKPNLFMFNRWVSRQTLAQQKMLGFLLRYVFTY